MKLSSFFVGLFFILAGLLLLLNNFGYNTTFLVGQLFKLWPLLLILIGASIYWGGKLPRWLAFILIILLVGGVIVLSMTHPSPGPYVQDSLIVERSDYPGLERGELEIKFGGGKLSLFEAHEEWLKGGFYGPRIRTERSVQGETLQLGLRQESYRLPRLVRRMHSDWEIGLSPDLNWEIELDAGAVKGDLDLSALPVDNFDLNLGAGDLTFALGDKSESTKVAVKAGASNITMLVPENVGVSVAVNGALASTNLNNLGWQKVDGRYFSPDYEDAEAQIDLDLELAVGNFSIKVEAVR